MLIKLYYLGINYVQAHCLVLVIPYSLKIIDFGT